MRPHAAAGGTRTPIQQVAADKPPDTNMAVLQDKSAKRVQQTHGTNLSVWLKIDCGTLHGAPRVNKQQ